MKENEFLAIERDTFFLVCVCVWAVAGACAGACVCVCIQKLCLLKFHMYRHFVSNYHSLFSATLSHLHVSLEKSILFKEAKHTETKGDERNWEVTSNTRGKKEKKPTFCSSWSNSLIMINHLCNFVLNLFCITRDREAGWLIAELVIMSRLLNYVVVHEPFSLLINQKRNLRDNVYTLCWVIFFIACKNR